jgi:membrane protein required for colicin V production
VPIAVIDIIFVALVLILAVRGALKGFVAEIGSVAALIAGFGGAFAFYKPLSALLDRRIAASMWNPLIAFLVLFLLLYLTVKLLERVLESVVDRLELERLDRVLGLFLGLAEALLLIGVVLFVLNWQPFFDPRRLLSGSFFAKMLFPLLPSPERIFRAESLLRDV